MSETKSNCLAPKDIGEMCLKIPFFSFKKWCQKPIISCILTIHERQSNESWSGD